MTSPDLLRIWALVEALPVAAHLETEWRGLLGNDYGVLLPFLRTETALATTYPCPDPVHDGCPRRVVRHGPEDIVAVCGNPDPQCASIRISRSDLVVRSLKRDEWTEAIARELGEANGLDSFEMEVPAGAVGLGTLDSGDRRIAVVWLRREVEDVEYLARGVQTALEGKDLVVILPPGSPKNSDRRLGGTCVVLLSPPPLGSGWLDLDRALDLLDPAHRERRVSDPNGIFGNVRLEFAEEPGVRHLVRINGQVFGGFQKSDIKFLRLLLLAAARAADSDVRNGGWMPKSSLRGGEERDRDLEKLRAELASHQFSDFSGQELKALIKSKRGTGTIRLAVRPTSIVFDDSLQDFEFISESTTKSPNASKRRTPGMDHLRKNLAAGLANGRLLLKDARRLGVPNRR